MPAREEPTAVLEGLAIDRRQSREKGAKRMVFREGKCDYSEIFSFGTYHPYWIDKESKTRNPAFDEFSGRILNVKEGQEPDIDAFATDFDDLFAEDIAVAYVPSHDPKKIASGIRMLAERFSRGRIDATSCLVRTKLVKKLADGGDRSFDVHYNSIVVKNRELIDGQRVVLLDDVSTTGNSLRACKALLLKAGAKRVKMAALGQTVRIH